MSCIVFMKSKLDIDYILRIIYIFPVTRTCNLNRPSVIYHTITGPQPPVNNFMIV